MTSIKHDIFISYSSKDKEACEQVVQALESQGLKCWMAPRNIVPGDVYASAIIDAISSSKIFLILISEYSNESVQVQKEVDRAVNGQLKIMAFMLKKVELSKALNYYLCDSHWIDGTSNREQAFKLAIDAAKLHILGEGTRSNFGLPTSMQTRSRKKKFPLSLKIFTFIGMMGLLTAGILLLRPDWQFKIRHAFGGGLSMKIAPLPSNRYGTWSERLYKRAQYFAEKNIDWFPPVIDHKLNREELLKEKIEDLEYKINEIQAHLGFIFDDPVLQQQFEGQAWYQPLHTNRSVEEVNDEVGFRMSIQDNDNIDLINSVIEEKLHAEAVQNNEKKYGSEHVKVTALPFLDIPASKLDPERRSCEGLSFETSQMVVASLLRDHKIPARFFPQEIDVVPFPNSSPWFLEKQGPVNVYIFFNNERAENLIGIFHNTTTQGLHFASKLSERINFYLAENKMQGGWYTDIGSEHLLIKKDSKNLDIIVEIMMPRDENLMSEYHHLPLVISGALVDLLSAPIENL